MRTPPKLDFGLWGSHQSTSSSSSEAEQDGGAALERLEAVDLLHHLLDGLVQALDRLLRLQAEAVINRPFDYLKHQSTSSKQLEAEQRLRQSLQKAVATKEELRLKAEEEIERLNQDIQEMMDEIDRLKTFPEPPEKEEQEENQIQVK